MKLYIIILIALLLVGLLCHRYYMYKYYRYRFLNLVLFSTDKPEYIEMYNLTRRFYKKYTNVDTVYYTYSENIEQDFYDHNSNILYIKGKESRIPGILDKTIKAFKYCLSYFDYKKYDYIVRTNISTIVNFDRLSYLLYSNSSHYAGGFKWTIDPDYRDKESGIVDDRYSGLEYCSGTCIIFSRELFRKMLERADYFDREVIDDVSIGYLIKEYFPEYNLDIFDEYFLFTDDIYDIDNTDGIKEICNQYIFFRNNSGDRDKDILIMKKIINQL